MTKKDTKKECEACSKIVFVISKVNDKRTKEGKEQYNKTDASIIQDNHCV
jgi:hypothetical protein